MPSTYSEPNMSSLLEQPNPSASDEEVLALVSKHYGLTGSLTRLTGERDLNALLESDEGRFVVKIANAAEQIEAGDMQAAALEHIATFDPALPIPRVRRSRSGRRVEPANLNGVDHVLRLVSFLDGTNDWDGPATPALGAAIGATLARLQQALRGFFHPAGGRVMLWDARHAGEIISWTSSIADPVLRRAVNSVLQRFPEQVLPALAGLPSQPIHNDFNLGNLLIDRARREVTGIIDFGDLVHGSRAQDLAVACSYVMLEAPDPLDIVQALVAAFSDHTPLLDEEVAVIGELIAVRLAQSVTIGSWRAVQHPANAEYILGDFEAVAQGIQTWLEIGEDQIHEALIEAAGVPANPDTSDRLEQRRAGVLSPGLPLFYQEPLHLVRGDGVRLYDAQGRSYLDAYNNVVQVGHANRRVIKAVNAQMRRLNTHTRYLFDAIVGYGELLTAQLPGPLEVCFFVNSGTEANDLAWRIAKTVTDNTGVIVTDHAYHGWTDAVIAMSPEEAIVGERAAWMDTVPPPGENDPKAQICRAIARLESRGHLPAALFIDSVFSSDGIFDLTSRYLTETAGAVRERGGVFVADEVQAGLGRVGKRFWGFAGDDVVPDIVTLGKPLGNGYPIGAVVTTHAIAEAFSQRGYFFSTFGGNPVAAAAASAVLRITLADDLAARAEHVGATLRDGLAGALQARGISAEVRGPATFIGVDLGSPELAAKLEDGLRSRGVLIGRTGSNDEVLKIRPPLIFNQHHARELLDVFSETLADIG